mmetsp:Transcript_1332/g.2507  ORF Transcript_1332/g.2507 Transcript_1332/m.2507 type:complete len:188 (+) Transcript_1332:81-644(+)
MQLTHACLLGLLLSHAAATRLRVDPNLEARVAAESQQNIQIHDGFLSQEKSDNDEVAQVKANKDFSALSLGHWVVGLDRDLKTQMLIQTQTNSSLPAIKDACGGITCGNLQCPAGFAATKIDGHCCPYCVNPDIKVEAAVTGATGSSGGKASTFCADVWCFPTMCTKGEVNPTTTNGQCCPTCPALL